MGFATEATCKNCDHMFQVRHGGGFRFHLLRCDRCGKEMDIGFDKLGELHLRYLKGLPGPYSVVTMDHDRDVQENADVEPIGEEEYHRAVEQFVGTHGKTCSGQFRLDAPARCPKCKSIDLDETDGGVMYD